MKLRRYWFWVLGSFLILILLAGLVFPYFLDVDHYREEIASKIEAATGRPVTVGKLRARLLPSIGFSIEEFRLGNPEDFPQGDFVAAEAIRGTLAFWPLLSGNLRLTSVELVRPRVQLLEDPRGRTNYTFSQGSTTLRPSDRPLDPGAILDRVELVEAELLLGQVAAARSGPERAARVTSFLKASNISAELRGLVFGEGALKRWQADADLEDVRLEVAGLSGPMVFQSGFVTLREGTIASEFELTFPGAPATKGRLHIPDITNVRAEFEITMPELDVRKAVAAQSVGERRVAGGTSPPARGNALLAEGTVRIERITWGTHQGKHAQATIRVFGDRIEVAPAKLALYEGALESSLRLTRQVTPQRFNAEVRLVHLNVAELLSAAPETRGKMTGTGEIRVSLAGTAGQGIRRSLSGTGNFAIQDGKFPGLDLGQTMRTFAAVQRILNLGQAGGVASGETTFRILKGDLTIREERVSSRLIELDSSVGIFNLRGSVGFDGSLHYDGRVVLAATEERGATGPADVITGTLGRILQRDVRRLSIPFALRGTLAEPKLQPGRGLPEIQTSDKSSTEEEKKSILDLFRRP